MVWVLGSNPARGVWVQLPDGSNAVSGTSVCKMIVGLKTTCFVYFPLRRPISSLDLLAG